MFYLEYATTTALRMLLDVPATLLHTGAVGTDWTGHVATRRRWARFAGAVIMAAAGVAISTPTHHPPEAESGQRGGAGERLSLGRGVGV